MVIKELMIKTMNAKSLLHCISRKRTKFTLHISSTSLREITAASNHSLLKRLMNWPSERLEWWKTQKRRKKFNHRDKTQKCIAMKLCQPFHNGESYCIHPKTFTTSHGLKVNLNYKLKHAQLCAQHSSNYWSWDLPILALWVSRNLCNSFLAMPF